MIYGMADDDLDNFDAARPEEVQLRFVVLEAQQHRDALVASLSPLELAQPERTTKRARHRFPSTSRTPPP